MSDAKRDEPTPPVAAAAAPQAAAAPSPSSTPLSTALPHTVATAPVPSGKAFRPLRHDIPLWQAIFFGVLCIVMCFGVWSWLTYGEEGEDRILSPVLLPSPRETFERFPDLWFRAELTRNTALSLRRVVLGFGLAALVGIPLGVLCGSFRRVNAFLAPLTIMGRNAPIAALIPLTFALFGTGELQKVMFIFVACIAFIIIDTANAIGEISERYIDSAYTLGASRWQIVRKVLVPLAMPGVFNSSRLLFGIAFGYIMLAETIQQQGEIGLGGIINMAQSRTANRPFILLVLMIIPLVALGVDRILYWIQKQLFPYYYGGSGLLHYMFVAVLRGLETAKFLFLKPVPPPK